MKKTLFTIAVCLCLSAPAYSQAYHPADKAKLDATYAELVKHPDSKECQMAFFKAFPSTFREFVMTSGIFTDEQFKAFRDGLALVPDTLYYDRLISLSIGGRWDADNVNYLAGHIRKCTEAKPKLMLQRLALQRKGYQLRFWQYFWSSLEASHEWKPRYEKLRAVMLPISPEQVKIMDIGFEYAWKELEYPDNVF